MQHGSNFENMQILFNRYLDNDSVIMEMMEMEKSVKLSALLIILLCKLFNKICKTET